MKNDKVFDITITAMMASLIFCGTFLLKIPSPFGYTHLGDSLLVLSVCLLGTRKSVYAGAIGAAMADLLSGFPIWVVPTLVIKSIFALIMGYIMYQRLSSWRFGWLAGAILGGVTQAILYTIVKIPLFGMEVAVVRLPVIAGQSICAIIIGGILFYALEKVSVVKMISGRRQ